MHIAHQQRLHEDVVGGAERPADRPRFGARLDVVNRRCGRHRLAPLPVAVGFFQKTHRGLLHGHGTAVIGEVVNAAVDNGIVHLLVRLRVDDRREVRAAARGKTAADFQCERTLEGHGVQLVAQLLEERPLGGRVGRVEVIDGKAGTVFELAADEPAGLFQLGHERIGAGQLAFHPTKRGLLRTGELLQAANIDPRIITGSSHKSADIVGIHPELASASKSQQHRQATAGLLGKAAQQLELSERFHGVAVDIAEGQRVAHHGLVFVHARKNDFLRGRTAGLANVQLARRAHLQPMHVGPDDRKREGIARQSSARAGRHSRKSATRSRNAVCSNR